jgi:hypothetical protein
MLTGKDGEMKGLLGRKRDYFDQKVGGEIKNK